MTSPHIKFCGLTRPEDVEIAVSLGADFLGFIVECKSPRRLSVSEAARLAAPVKGLAKRVAVTVNPDDKLIGAILDEMQESRSSRDTDKMIEKGMIKMVDSWMMLDNNE